MNNAERKAKLNEAFKLMRGEGLVARQSFTCCRSCAGCELVAIVGKMTPAKQQALKGAAFYTRQDAKGMSARRFAGVYIGFGPVETIAVDLGLPAVEVGRIVVRCLEAVGLPVEWSGSEHERVWVPFQPTF
jgi:hypothetical protein